MRISDWSSDVCSSDLGFDKLDSQPIGNVPACLRRSRPAETAKAAARLLASAAAEQSFEYIPEVRALAAEFMGGSTRSPGTKAAAATAAKAEWRRRISVAVNFAPVALRALVFVHQEVIGVRHLREFFRGFRIVRIPVGMQFLGKIAIGLLDIGQIGRAHV